MKNSFSQKFKTRTATGVGSPSQKASYSTVTVLEFMLEYYFTPASTASLPISLMSGPRAGMEAPTSCER